MVQNKIDKEERNHRILANFLDNQMTETLTLAAKKRVPTREENRKLKENRRVLGVVYGQGREPIPVSVDASDVLRAYRQVGTSTLFDLDIEGEKVRVLMKEVNLHPVRYEINHVDFFAANLKKKAIVHVDLDFVGESPAVKLGGMLVTVHKSLNIKCLPENSPRTIEVSLDNLKVPGDTVTIADLGLDSKKYEVIGLPESEIICLVKAKRGSAKAETTEEESTESTEETKSE